MIYLNDIVEFTKEGRKFRIVFLNHSRNTAWLYPLFGKNSVPIFIDTTILEELLSKRTVMLCKGVEQHFQTRASPAAIQKRDSAFDSIKPLIETEAIFRPAERNELINSRAVELKCSPQTLWRTLRLFWLGGQTRNALIPKFHLKGSTEGATSNRGRRPKYTARNIYQVTDVDLRIFKKAINSGYLKGVTATIAGTHAAMLRKHYSVVDSEGLLQPKAPGEFPTLEQFRRYFKNNYSSETVIRSREGNAEFELNHRAKLGSAELSVFTVGDRYEIDATIADVFLVSSADRRVIVGKPTLYLVVDSKSWLIVGFYTGFEQPSWPAALQAIASIAEDKKTLCGRYGLTYSPKDWPADGVMPKQFVGDRGEMISKASSSISDELEVTILNLPSKMANRKPHVECGFKLIQRPMAEHIPGYEPPENFRKRQGKHYDKDASLTLEEFTGIILRAITRFNNSARAGYPLTPAQTYEGLIPTPCNVWNHEIRTRSGALRRYSSDYIKRALLPRGKATVTREGIRFSECYYACEESIQRGWFTRAGRGAFEVIVSYDRRLVDNILVHDPINPGQVFISSLVEKSAIFKGLSLREVEAVAFKREMIRQEGQYRSRRRDFEFHSAVDPITNTARAEAQIQSRGKSRSSRKVDIREQRATELTLERQQKATMAKPKNEQNTAEVVSISSFKSPIQTTPEQARNAKLIEMLNGN